MTKTQESVLKQCISSTLILFLFLGVSPRARAYSSIAPLETKAGPPEGLLFEPEMGVSSGPGAQTEVQLGLQTAITPALSGFGRYSLQNDDRLGVNLKLLKTSGFEVSAQLEGLYLATRELGATFGVFAEAPVRLHGLPHLSFNFGIALSEVIASETTTLPYSALLTHLPEKQGCIYGVGITGEVSASDDQSWNSFQSTLGFQNRSSLQFLLTAAAPLTETSAHPEISLRFGLVIPFGGGQEADPLPKTPKHLTADSLPHYNLNAEISSMNEALFLLKIDKGSSDSIEKGQTFDIYSDEELMARAQVISVKKDEAALNVIEYKQEHWIELGFSARRLGE